MKNLKPKMIFFLCCAIFLESCGIGGRGGYMVPLSGSEKKLGFYGGPSAYVVAPFNDNIYAVGSGGPVWNNSGASGLIDAGLGWGNNLPMKNTMSSSLSVSFRLGIEFGKGIAWVPAVCGSYTRAQNPGSSKNSFWVIGDACFRYSTDKSIKIDIGSYVVILPIYAG